MGIFKNLCVVDAQGQDASLAKVSYLAGGAVGSFYIIWTALHPENISWPYVFVYIGYLAYHLGPQVFKQFLDKLPGKGDDK